MRTLLFDIDGTLLTAHGGGRRAMLRTLREEFGLEHPEMVGSFHGRTDMGLMAQMLEMNGLEPTQQRRRRFRVGYAERFPGELQRSGGEVFVGVAELLKALAPVRSCRLASMTGNLPETATRKLEHFHLRQFIQWIVGGDLDAQRNDLASRTLETIRRRHGDDACQDVVVIGDTVADIVCARHIGASVVAVCTGGETYEELSAAGPDAIWHDFSDHQGVAECLLGDL
ncbi:HAD family hydrolase [Crateriforma spongiae]|uniref:HAD family hydrolase n=1 Tax=Crateriforma spongiae TaxID=2724528 RepID=UPI0014453DD7|nr:HAD family hydrolase [Crateriforma spongiae]